MRVALVLLALAGCGGQPLLAGAPQPNPAVMAGAAAAIAGAATLANPNLAGHKPEDNGPGKQKQDVKSTMMPADVLDRLDAHEPPPADPPPEAPTP